MSEALKTTWMRDALAWLSGPREQEEPANPTDKPYRWLWEAIQGDFNEERSTGQIAFDAGISMIPLVDQICDVRDLIANCRKLDQDMKDGGAWLALALTLVGLFPSLGSLVKGVLKIFFVFVRRHGLDLAIDAIDQGMTWVITYLRKREVQKYLRELQVDEVFGWLADRVREVRGQVDTAALLAAFDEGIGVVRNLVAKVEWLPAAHQRARATLDTLLSVRKAADEHIGKQVEPLQKVLDAIAQRLGRETALARSAIHNVENIHFRGGLPQATAVTLMKGEPKPKWLSEGTKRTWEPVMLKEVRPGIDKSVAKGWPPMTDKLIESFHELAAVEIRGPARLYRVVSPSSRAMSDCWVSEAVFDRLRAAPNPREAWRKHLAVWPDWNPNGQFVVYELKQGETLKVWRGKTASQLREKTEKLKFHLEGGWEQIVFNVPRSSSFNDAMATFEKLPGGKLRGLLSPSETAALPRERTVQLRQNILHPDIRGPFETGWGYTDFEAELMNDRIGLPALPGQITK